MKGGKLETDRNDYSYILITPAKNEEKYIERTIQSVISQTILPKKWIIVSDGSTDRTDEIVSKYTKKHSWIELMRRPEHEGRQFSAKVYSFNEGYEKTKNLIYDIIGNLDADISLEKDHFEYLLDKFSKNPNLGVAGTPFVEEVSGAYDYRFANIEHVSGACQLFRRECFEEIGGYTPNEIGIDWLAVTTARMKGWQTRTFTDRKIFHHRRIGTGKSNFFVATFKQGKADYYFGNHPLWELFRAFYQMAKKPFICNGLLLFFGYMWALLIRTKRPLSKELMKFHQKEQMQRLKKIVLRRFF